MSVDNPLWGAPRIHGELLKLGFEVAQSSVAKNMVKRCGPPSLGWRTFLRNHAPDIAAMDLFVAPTIGFDLLYVLVIVRLERRNLVWINVTPHPTAEWIARQVTDAFPWAEAPRYLIRDRDRALTALPSPTDYGPWPKYGPAGRCDRRLNHRHPLRSRCPPGSNALVDPALAIPVSRSLSLGRRH